MLKVVEEKKESQEEASGDGVRAGRGREQREKLRPR